jgi:short chain dehydrogenase
VLAANLASRSWISRGRGSSSVNVRRFGHRREDEVGVGFDALRTGSSPGGSASKPPMSRGWARMSDTAKTVIVTGGSQGIGAGAVKAFLDRNYNVVATSRNVTKSKDLPSSPKLALVDGDIGDATTALRVAETAISRFGSIDALVNNAGIFFTKPFIDYTARPSRA